MTKELVISANRHETKVAVLEDDQLVEIYFQRSNEYSLVGSIHKGKVTRVLPGMQSAFVELGLERDAFLYVSDFFEEAGEEYERVGTPGDRRRPAATVPPPVAAPPPAAQSPAAPDAGEEAPAPISRDQSREGRDQDGRERRGRRSRRRRSRGRGFPDTKYTSPESAVANAASTEIEPTPVAPETDQEVDVEPLVLPGESLAKYRDRATEGEPEPDESESPDLIAGSEAEFKEESGPSLAELDSEETVAELVADVIDEISGRERVPQPDSLNGSEGEEEEEETPLPGPSQQRADFDDEISEFGIEETAAREGLGDQPGEADEAASGSMELLAEDSLEPAAEETEEGPSTTEQPARQADVREPVTARYIVRGQRRVRRRGGRDPRVESAEAARPGRPEAGSAAVRPEREPYRERERSGRPDRPERTERERPPLPLISDLLKEGQEIIVQIAKEPLGQKGARITSHLAMPGRYVVYMPTIEHGGGVSRKIASDEERQRLKRILQTHSMGMSGGFIVRTAGEGRTESEIAADMNFLYNQWLDIRNKAEKRPAPCLLHHDLELVTRTLRDQVSEQFRAIWVDNEEIYEGALRFLERFQPSMVSKVKLYTRETPIFDTFNITSELEKALRPKVWLKSGGYIVINQTEALVAVDINTGKFVGKSNRLEDTIVKTNVEAIREIVRQIRLRDLGGIIVVDFIDMDERKNRQKVMQALEEAMRSDRAPYKILQFNDFGLVAITRRRVKQSLERALCSPCPTCEAAGYVKSVATVVGEIINEAHKIASTVEGSDVMLRVPPEVAKFLKANKEHYLEELEEILGRQVIIKSDPQLHPEKFDLV